MTDTLMKIQIKIVLISFLLGPVLCDPQEYCDLSCKDGLGKDVMNTVCEFKCEVAGTCTNFEDVPLSDKSRQYAMDVHNFFRNRVAAGEDTRGGNGAAENMNVFNYDTDVEYTASCWAKRCTFEHDKCRRTKKFEYNGQNLYTTSVYPKKKFTEEELLYKAAVAWFDEITLTSKSTLQSFSGGGGYGHFTQMVWAETTHVGCAIVAYEEGTFFTHFVACNYGPGGNMISQPVYKHGKAGASCSVRNNEYSALCGNVKQLSSDRTPIEYSSSNICSVSNCYIALLVLHMTVVVFMLL